MLFSSITFLYYFLPAVIALYYLAPKCMRNSILLLSSFFFYGWGEPKYLLLMLFSIAQAYVFGLLIERYRKEKSSRVFLTASLVCSLFLLGYFKYADFFLESVRAVTGIPVKMFLVLHLINSVDFSDIIIYCLKDFLLGLACPVQGHMESLIRHSFFMYE